MWICYLNGKEKTKTAFRVFRVYRVNEKGPKYPRYILKKKSMNILHDIGVVRATEPIAKG